MACPFLDPSMLARLPAEKREEMKEMYMKMKKEQNDHLKIDVKEEDIDNVTPEQMMMGMTGATSSTLFPQQDAQGCPVMGGSGATQGTPENGFGMPPGMDSMQDQFETDPQAFLKRMQQMSQDNSGGSCPMMSAKYFDPFNEETLSYGYEAVYKSRWAFLIDNKGRLTSRKFRAGRKLLDRLPTPLKHTLFHPDDLKKLRQKPFSGLFFNFDKHKEEANKLYQEGKYFDALEYYEQILGVFKWVEFTDAPRNEDFFKALNLEPLLDKDIVVKEKDLGDDECEIEMRTNLVVTLLMSMAYCYLKLFFYEEA